MCSFCIQNEHIPYKSKRIMMDIGKTWMVKLLNTGEKTHSKQ